MADEDRQPQVARCPVNWHNHTMSKDPKEHGAKRRLVFVEELSRQAAHLEELNAGLAGTVEELQAALAGLVEACESGSTSRYIGALGRSRRLQRSDVAGQNAPRRTGLASARRSG